MTGELPLDDEAIEYIYQLYHKNLPPLVTEATLATATTASAQSDPPTSKSYRRAPTLPLGDVEETPFVSQLRQRASYSDPADRRPITDTELATLLTAAYGDISGDGEGHRRPVASAGACYPLELYPIVLDSPDIDPGLYHFDIEDDALDRLQQADYTDWVQDNWSWITEEDRVAAVIAITAIPARSAERYGEMGYLFACIEAGAVVQNLQLVAMELGIGSRPHNGLNYSSIREELGLRSNEYLLSTVVFAGKGPDVES
ncbi:MAG: SagB-type dehydrogenase domain protein [uncultured archaeon A07HN63]|nr:MAG: SagB-type dehydrogenase domain protein [uncultured archaeon A07HN63]